VEGLEYLLSFGLETQEATKRINDVWTALRELSSRAILLQLKANPDFNKAQQEIKELEASMKELSDSSGNVEEAQKKLAKQIEDSMAGIERLSKGAGKAIQEAFSAGGADTARKKIEALKKEIASASRAPRGSITARAAPIVELGQRVVGAAAAAGFGNQAARTVYSARRDVRKADLREQRIASRVQEINDSIKTGPKPSRDEMEYFKGSLFKLQDALKGIKSDKAKAIKIIEQARGQFGQIVDDYVSMLDASDKVRIKLSQLKGKLARSQAGGTPEAARMARRLEETIKLWQGMVVPSPGSNSPLMSEAVGKIDARRKGAKFDSKGFGAAGESVISALEQQRSASSALPAGSRAELEAMLHTKMQNAYNSVVGAMMHAAMSVVGKTVPTGVLQEHLSKLMPKVVSESGVAGSTGSGPAAGVTVDPETLYNSIGALFRDEARIARIRAKVHAPKLLTSIDEALRLYENQESSILTLLVNLDIPKHQGIELHLNQQFFIQQIKAAIEVAQKMFAFNLQAGMSRQILNSQVGATGTGTARTRGLSDAEVKAAAEAKIKEGILRRADAQVRSQRASADPMGILSSHGVDRTLMQSVVNAKTSKSPQMYKEAMKNFMAIVEQYRQGLEGLDAAQADLLTRAYVEFRKQHETPVRQLGREHDRRSLMKDYTEQQRSEADAAKQAYNQDVMNKLVGHQSAFADIYKDYANTPLDPHKEDLAAYKRVYAEILGYNRELLAYTHARSQEELKTADKRISAARRSVEVAQDELNIQLLLGRTFKGQSKMSVRRTEAQFRVGESGAVVASSHFVKENGEYVRDQVSLAEAYKHAATLLRSEFGPGLDALNTAQRELRRTMLEEARQFESTGHGR
jgi:hypothetical protein